MIIVMKPNAADASVNKVLSIVEESGLKTHLSRGDEVTIIGVVGDKTKLDTCSVQDINDVEKIVNITESYKLSNKKFHPDPTVIRLRNTCIGPDNLTLISGPCAIESEEQIVSTAKAVKKCGATILRGGAFKPRTSPYSFQGLEEEGLKYMKIASEETGLDTVC